LHATKAPPAGFRAGIKTTTVSGGSFPALRHFPQNSLTAESGGNNAIIVTNVV